MNFKAAIESMEWAARSIERSRCIEAIKKCRSLDENGYICEKAEAIKAILDLGDAGEKAG